MFGCNAIFRYGQVLTPSRHTSKKPDAHYRRCAAWSCKRTDVMYRVNFAYSDIVPAHAESPQSPWPCSILAFPSPIIEQCQMSDPASSHSPIPKASSLPSVFPPKVCTRPRSKPWPHSGVVLCGDDFWSSNAVVYSCQSAGGRTHGQCGEGAVVAGRRRKESERANEEESVERAAEEVSRKGPTTLLERERSSRFI